MQKNQLIQPIDHNDLFQIYQNNRMIETQQEFIRQSLRFREKKKIGIYLIFLDEMLGKGSFAKVYKGINTVTNEYVAIKVIQQQLIWSQKISSLINSQINILKSLSHPSILNCYQFLLSDNNCYIISQLCQSQLKQYLNTIKSLGNYSQIMEGFIYDVYQGLLYLARRGIVHRDIKINNILVKDGKAKIADFGFANTNIQNININAQVGSPAYMAPQSLISNLYSQKSDVWAFGILIFQMYHQYTPFQLCKNHNQLIKQIQIPFTKKNIKSDIPQYAVDIICSCLTIQVKNRPYFMQLLTCPFIKSLRIQKNSIKSVNNQSKIQQKIDENIHADKLNIPDQKQQISLDTIQKSNILNQICQDVSDQTNQERNINNEFVQQTDQSISMLQPEIQIKKQVNKLKITFINKKEYPIQLMSKQQKKRKDLQKTKSLQNKVLYLLEVIRFVLKSIRKFNKIYDQITKKNHIFKFICTQDIKKFFISLISQIKLIISRILALIIDLNNIQFFKIVKHYKELLKNTQQELLCEQNLSGTTYSIEIHYELIKLIEQELQNIIEQELQNIQQEPQEVFQSLQQQPQTNKIYSIQQSLGFIGIWICKMYLLFEISLQITDNKQYSCNIREKTLQLSQFQQSYKNINTIRKSDLYQYIYQIEISRLNNQS